MVTSSAITPTRTERRVSRAVASCATVAQRLEYDERCGGELTLPTWVSTVIGKTARGVNVIEPFINEIAVMAAMPARRAARSPSVFDRNAGVAKTTVRVGIDGFGRMGRLAGTVLSGWACQEHNLEGCRRWSAGIVLAAALLSLPLPEVAAGKPQTAGV